MALWTGGSPQGLAVVDGWIYWADATENAIQRMRTDGTERIVLASGQEGASGISVAGGLICWTNTTGGEVRTMPSGGGAIVTLATAQAAPLGVTIAGGTVFFATAYDLMEVPLAGGAVVSRLQPDGRGGVQGVASVGGAAGYVGAAPQAAVFPVASSGDAGVSLLQPFQPYSEPSVRGMAWTEDGEGTTSVFFAGIRGIFSATVVPPGPAVRLATDASWAEAVAVDARTVYWVDSGTPPSFDDGAVMRLPRTGGTPVVLAASLEHPLAIALDDAFVYWTDAGTTHPGAVMRAGK